MREAILSRLSRSLSWSWPSGPRLIITLVFLVGTPALTAQGTAKSTDDFRPGLYFSQTRPLTAKQKAALLQDLKRLTGFMEITTDEHGFLTVGNRAYVVAGSATARGLIEAVVDGDNSYTIESHYQSPAVAFARIRARLDYVNAKVTPRLRQGLWSVEMDFHDYKQLRGEADVITAFDPSLTLLHELAHAALRLRDSTGKADPLGDCERYINVIRRELGLPERQNYESVNTQAVTPYGTAQRVLAEIRFARIDPGKGVKTSRLTFDVGNVYTGGLVTPGPAAVRR